MSGAQMQIAAILAVAAGLFIWGRPRYDIVALLALIAATLCGLIPASDMFAGFGHPAVITVAAVLVISRGLRNAGVVQVLSDRLAPLLENPLTQIGALTILCAVCSAFMNNVGALAILMPLALESTLKQGRSPALVLMPLSFGAILGGLATMIGTPPNVIIAAYRQDLTGEAFGMFDFSPVGAVAAAAGVVFLVIVGWRLIPRERSGRTPPEMLFSIDEYMSELRVPAGSPLAGSSLAAIADKSGIDVAFFALIRGEERRPAPSRRARLQEGDILVVNADPTEIKRLVDSAGLELVGDVALDPDTLRSADIVLAEAVISPNSPLEGRTPGMVGLRRAHGLNLIAAARRDEPIRRRLDEMHFRAGDVLLLQGDSDAMGDSFSRLNLLPLAQRQLGLGREPKVLLAVGLFALALAATAVGLVPAALSLTAAAVAYVLLGLIPVRELYEAVDWPVIVLLGSMIPVGGALETSGAAAALAAGLADIAAGAPLWLMLALVLIVTMTLSDIMNNAATVVVMAPIAVGLAGQTGGSVDAFLMAVAIGGSCAFLTPIGHQCNTLVMGPGGYRFGDFWRVGLPLEVLIILIAIPLLLVFWS